MSKVIKIMTGSSFHVQAVIQVYQATVLPHLSSLWCPDYFSGKG
ncbi:hypothetical protein YE105_C3323 [Yersinia enterocolitica subsp. palearctica 105.5R(r)]|uniref:Uncharacterized protein n=1 Tax=Yersinia enterocolitica subsp. palearctica serotype O:3 (strain DSM 13030 / CIP 106945 / Y11) TaxID=930944 RepID=A0A0H3NMW5_YERE1|nr:hypothetical protein YE105_C3323 [Yersinia enterocolitica subsp. palearctica 105.5R(r)]CBY25731.1 hypothetical protein Y11_24501 [Yersinia enterocolitica subsp. palearctica Y11]CCO70102.1 hypothetical protein D322_3245 [Yersinia enterocolitica IP 10393]